MKKKIDTEMRLVEDHLNSINDMQEPETDPFFYTRLRAKMDQQQDWQFPVKPFWIVTSLALLLLLNAAITFDKFKKIDQPVMINNASLQGFAANYDLTIQSTY